MLQAKIERLERIFLNSWKQFNGKKEYRYKDVLDLFMQSKLTDKEYRYWKADSAIEYCDLMDDVFVPDMTENQQVKTMQERLDEEEREPSWWAKVATSYDEYMYSPFELHEIGG